MNNNSIYLLSPAKVNLFLSILEKRNDGYYNLLNIMQKITLFDFIAILKAEDGINVYCPKLNIPNEKNIAFKAAELFFKRANIKNAGVKISIEKNIPAGGGLGGGSSNAATVLKGLNKLFDKPLSAKELEEIGKLLGADVPFFIRKGSWLMTKKGDEFSCKIYSKPFYYILFFFGEKSETKKVYKSFSLKNRDTDWIRIATAMEKGNASLIKKNFNNSLSDAFFKTYPKQLQIYVDLKQKMCNNLYLSGSGATFFSLFDSKKKLVKAYENLDEHTKKFAFVAKTFLE